jgi:hypothetical protein
MLIDLIPRLRRGRAQEVVVDVEAISLIRTSENDEAAYQTARAVMRLAREKHDRSTEQLFARIAVRIADVTGRQIGPSREVGDRYQAPKRQIEGDRTVKRR